MTTATPRRHIAAVSILVAAFIVVGFALNLRGLNAPMYYDSGGLIEGNRALFMSHDVLGVIGIFPQRPLAMLSFELNYLLSGMSPWHFRLWNIVLLGLTAFVVVVSVHFLLSYDRRRQAVSQSELRLVCVLMGLVFLVHPLLTQLTLYIWQRTALMACFFYMCALTVHLAIRTGRIRRPLWGHVVSAIFFVGALLSKENAATLPIVLILADAVLFRDGLLPLAKRATAYLSVAAACIVGLSFVERAHGHFANEAGILHAVSQYYAESGLSFHQVIFIQCRVIFDYLSMILVPTTARIQLVSPQIVTGSGASLISFAALAGTTALAVAGLIFTRTRPLWGFGLLFFLINLVPESILVPQYAFFGYRAVLPMIGLLFIAADCLIALLQYTSSGTMKVAVRLGIGILAVASLTAMTSVSLARVKLWSDPVRFWQDAVDNFPAEDRYLEHAPASQALHNLGRALQQSGRYQEAVDPLTRALNITPKKVVTLTALAAVFAQLGRFDQAEALLRTAIELQPDSGRAHRELGDILAQRGSMKEAFEEFRTALRLNPKDDMLHDAVARALVAQGKYEEAAIGFRRAIAFNDRSYVAYTNLGALLLRMNRIDEAGAHAKRALEIRPDYWNANQIMGVVLAMNGRLEEAIVYLRRAEKMNPGSTVIKENLATALKQLKDSGKTNEKIP